MLLMKTSLAAFVIVINAWLPAVGTEGKLLSEQSLGNRSFVIDYKHNTFLKDGEPFRYISGSVHYFRIHPGYWRDRLLKMYAAGLNAISVYVPWFLHEPEPGNYNFTGILDLEGFLKTAQDIGFLVVLRPGPYICSALDFGGLPGWLMKDKGILVRTSNKAYIAAVDRYFDVLLPKIKPFLYENGGPIITIQAENEYGSYFACDYDYTRYLRMKLKQLLSNRVVLFTTDGYESGFLRCGPLQGILATIDGPLTDDPEKIFKPLRKIQPNGPLVFSEFYMGQVDYWKGIHHTWLTEGITKSLDAVLAYGANLNVYMFHGGTNFGYNAGALGMKYVTTSYDSDAPITEAGDITNKYIAIRKVIAKYNKLPHVPVPQNTSKYSYDAVSMEYAGTIQDVLELVTSSHPIKSQFPVSMEDIGQSYGFILYRFVAAKDYINTVMDFSTVRDRIYVMLDGFVVGRATNTIVTLRLSIYAGQVVDLLVENMGRIFYGPDMNYNRKGLVTNVTLNGSIVEDWTIFPLDLNKYHPENLEPLKKMKKLRTENTEVTVDLDTPSFYTGSFLLPITPEHPMDTFVDTKAWTKGQIFINGFNLGRFWPNAGPQVTLFLPKQLLKPYPAINRILVFELERAPCTYRDCLISFIDHPIYNAKLQNVSKTHQAFHMDQYKFYP